MGKIRQLDEQTANMIAAGEVVERPMGVVKELIENAIDAGSTRIDVSVTDGGITRITVRDNGSGMDSEDAVNAFHRHATSKIRSQNDLWNIHTMGFRGEALPSIASVAKVTLITSDGNEATRLQIEYGKTVSVSAYPCDQGTEITVEGLFYRTPARLKHLKSGSYENTLVQDVVTRFAMSHPEIAFTYRSNDHEALRTSGQGELLEVIFSAWGREAAQNALPVDFSDYDYHVTGYIIKPSLTRASRNYMHVFLNRRMVRTYRLYKAIQDGYEDFIVKQRNPMVVLNVEMDPHLLDVNVHPSKWEVRISKETQLEYLIRDNIRETLKNALLAPVGELKKTAEPVHYSELSFDMDNNLRHPYAGEEKKPVTMPVQTQITVPVQPEAVREPEVYTAPEIHKEPEKRSFPEMTVIGQLHRKFILCAVEQGLAVLDQHACQERVHYEEIRAKLNAEPVMTDCLVPISVQAGNDLVQRVDEINESIADLHIVFEPFGRDTLLVRSHPLWMQEIDEEAFLQDVLDNFRNSTESKYARMEKKKIATMACHRSIRFNRSLTAEEMQEVVRQLALCENPYHCPHGRPTFVIVDEKELTKEFLR